VIILLTILVAFALSVGQVLFKLSANEGTAAQSFIAALLNLKFFMALFVYALATFLWLYILSKAPLSHVYPFVALSFIFVPIMSMFFLNDALTWRFLIGGALIVVGVWVSVLNDQP